MDSESHMVCSAFSLFVFLQWSQCNVQCDADMVSELNQLPTQCLGKN